MSDKKEGEEQQEQEGNYKKLISEAKKGIYYLFNMLPLIGDEAYKLSESKSENKIFKDIKEKFNIKQTVVMHRFVIPKDICDCIIEKGEHCYEFIDTEWTDNIKTSDKFYTIQDYIMEPPLDVKHKAIKIRYPAAWLILKSK